MRRYHNIDALALLGYFKCIIFSSQLLPGLLYCFHVVKSPGHNLNKPNDKSSFLNDYKLNLQYYIIPKKGNIFCHKSKFDNP